MKFDSWAEWFAARYQLRGAKALKTTLAELVAEQGPREYFLEAAGELAAVGLMPAAKLVAKAAIKCPPMTDMRFYSYTTVSEIGIMAWQQSQQRRADTIRKRIKGLLHQAGLSLDWLGEEGLSGAGELLQEGAKGL